MTVSRRRGRADLGCRGGARACRCRRCRRRRRRRLRALMPFCAPRNPVDCTAQAVNELTLIGAFTESMAADGGYRVDDRLPDAGRGGTTHGAEAAADDEGGARENHPDRLWVLSISPRRTRCANTRRTASWCFEDPTRAVVAIERDGPLRRRLRRAGSRRRRALPDVTLPGDHAVRGRGASASWPSAGMPAVPEAACAHGRGSGRGGGAHRLPGGREDPVARHPAQERDRRRAAGRRPMRPRCARASRRCWRARRERAPARAHRGRAGRQADQGRGRDGAGHRARPGLRAGRDGRPRRRLHRDPEGCLPSAAAPSTTAEAEAMIRSLKGFPLLDGARGRPKADVAALAGALSALSRFAARRGPTPALGRREPAAGAAGGPGRLRRRCGDRSGDSD